MRADCGFDEVDIDAVGNVVGIYHGSDPQRQAPADRQPLRHRAQRRQVRRPAGHLRADGLRARTASRQGRRLPFGFEVVGFAEEEGQRYKAIFLGSGALTGHFDPAWLEQHDADGITHAPGHASTPGCASPTSPSSQRDAVAVPRLRRGAHRAGPGAQRARPAAGHRHLDQRQRALPRRDRSAWPATPARRRWTAAATPPPRSPNWRSSSRSAAPRRRNLVATIGMLEVPNGSINVVPGRCKFSLDIRATTNEVRDACAADVRAELQRICERRGLHFKLEETMRAAAAPSDAGLAAALGARGAGAGPAAVPHAQRRRPRCDEAARGDAAGHALRARAATPASATTRSNRSPTTTPNCAVRAFQNLLEQLATELIMTAARYAALDAWIDAHFDEEVQLSASNWCACRPTRRPATTRRTPNARPSCCRPSASTPRSTPCRWPKCRRCGLRVDHQPDRSPPLRRGQRPIALNAHGDVVPPGEGWTHDPYGGEVVDGKLYGRAAAVSKCDFATFTFATRALESLEAAAEGRRRAALHLRRGIRRRARARLAAASTG